ncbi:MAG: hypothetical protein LUG99_09235 [Lachnospiraceae bacterium]|nr:hypothetical protein [Lachnospiraceae bacterium]
MSEDNTITKVYVSAPYWPTSIRRDEMALELRRNTECILKTCRLLTLVGCMPLSPALYFPRFMDTDGEARKQEFKLLSLEWLSEADEVWVAGERISDDMAEEISIAREKGIPVLAVGEPEELAKKYLEEHGNLGGITDRPTERQEGISNE